MLSIVLTAGWGLNVPMHLVWPVTLLTAALLSAVGAGWTGNLLASDRRGLLAVVGVAAVTALIPCALVVTPAFSPAARALMPRWPLIYTSGACVAVLSGTAGASSLWLRGEGASRVLIVWT
jgi:hypothetical protein